MRALKAVKQNYQPTPEVFRLLECFRMMVNDCIRIGIQGRITSLKTLSLEAYRELSFYEVPSYYKTCAISKATGILKNYHRARRKNPKANRPLAKKLMLTSCYFGYGFKVEKGTLKLPLGKRKYVHIPLNNHTRDVLSDPIVTLRSVCLTDRTISISFSKELTEINPVGYLGIDRNLNNVTTADTAGQVQRLDLSQATRIKTKYREVTSHFKCSDHRVRTKVRQKYGFRQRERVQQIIHCTSKLIVQRAKDSQHGIVMERLTGIRKLYTRRNGKDSSYRFLLNSWSYAELQRQIDYKARCEGLPVLYVNPFGTSVKCSVCGSLMRRIPEEDRKLKCASCGVTLHRDINAAKNILARALRFGAVGPATEAMVAVQRCPVDVGQLTSKRTKKPAEPYFHSSRPGW